MQNISIPTTMTYTIRAYFNSQEEALKTGKKIASDGFVKEISSYTENSHFHPESLVEDHFIDEKEILVYTPNLNRAFRAFNLLKKSETVSLQTNFGRTYCSTSQPIPKKILVKRGKKHHENR